MKRDGKRSSADPLKVWTTEELTANVKVARALASNPEAPSSLLELLACHTDRYVRRHVAANPSSAPQVAMRVGNEFPGALVRNPALDRFLVEEPCLLDGWNESVLTAILKQPQFPPCLMIWFAREREGSRFDSPRQAIFLNPVAPREAIEKLVADRAASFSYSHSAGTGTAADVTDIHLELLPALMHISLENATEDLNWRSTLQTALARRAPRVKRIKALAFLIAAQAHRARRKVSADELWAVSSAVTIRSQKARKRHLNAILGSRAVGAGERHAALSRFLTDQDAIEDFIRHPKAPRDWLEKLIEKPYLSDALLQRADIAELWTARRLEHGLQATPLPTQLRYTSIPDEVVAQLDAAYQQRLVKQIVAEQQHKTVKASAHKDSSFVSNSRTATADAVSDETPCDSLAFLAGSADPYEQTKAARDPHCPPDILIKLSSSNDRDVLRAVFRNPATPPAALDKCGWLDQTLAHERLRSRSVGSEGKQSFIKWLATHPDPRFRLILARYKGTPSAVLSELYGDRDPTVSLAARNNHAKRKRRYLAPLFSQIQIQPADAALIQDAIEAPDPGTCMARIRADMVDRLARPTQPSPERLAALILHDCPPRLLARARLSTDWVERCVIAAHPGTPLAALKALSLDGNVLVRAAARENLGNRTKEAASSDVI